MKELYMRRHLGWLADAQITHDMGGNWKIVSHSFGVALRHYMVANKLI